MSGMLWSAQGNCTKLSSEDKEVFFPPRGRPSIDPAYKEHCGPCPVKQQCLMYAVVNKMDDGVWGNLRPNERKALANSQPKLVANWRALAIKEGWYAGEITDYLPEPIAI